MKINYPVADGKGGISQQKLELASKAQRDGVKRLLRIADVKTDALKTVVDLGCRNGDTTLGILEVVPRDTNVIGIDEILEALAIASAKFGFVKVAELTRLKNNSIFSSQNPDFMNFRRIAGRCRRRCSFVCSELERVSNALKDRKADLIIGFQLLHWIDADETGLPKLDIMRSIRNLLTPTGIFVAGTSTAFIAIDPKERIEGKKKEEYVVDKHPFFELVYGYIARFVSEITGKPAPEPVNTNPPLGIDKLRKLYRDAGFKNFRTGAFLSTFGREVAVTEQIKLRPAHQGRLTGIDSRILKRRIINSAVVFANSECNLLVSAGKPDPRLDKDHIYDAVPFIVASA